MATKVQALTSAADKGFWDEGPGTELNKTAPEITVGRRSSTDPQARANTWFFAFLRPNQSDMIAGTYASGSRFENLVAAYSDNGEPVTVRIFGLLGNPPVPSTKAQAQALLVNNLTTAFVDWTIPVQTADVTVHNSPDLTAIDQEMGEDPARTSASIPWGYVFAPNGISAGVQKVRTFHAPNAGANLWPEKAWVYTAENPGGGLPFITSVVGPLGNNWVAEGGSEVTINGGGFFGGGGSDDVIDLEVDGVETPPPAGNLHPKLDLGAYDFWGDPIPGRAGRAGAPDLTESGAQVTLIRSYSVGLNASNGFDNPTFEASLSDPPRTFTENFNGPGGGSRQHTIPHFPAGAVPATGSDGYMHIVDGVSDPDVPVLYTHFGVSPRNGSGPMTSCSHAYKCNNVWKVGVWPETTADTPASCAYGGNYPSDWDGYNQGPRSGGFDAGFGLIHAEHFERGFIGHALVATVRPEILQQLGGGPLFIPPATQRDADQVGTVQTGNCPLGMRLTMPTAFDPENDVSNQYAKIIARAIYDYGIIFGDRGGGPGLAFHGGGGSFLQTVAGQINASGDWEVINNSLVICNDRGPLEIA